MNSITFIYRNMGAATKVMKYSKVIIILLTGLIALSASFILGADSGAYGFLIGYGYTATIGGMAGILFAYRRNQQLRKQDCISSEV